MADQGKSDEGTQGKKNKKALPEGRRVVRKKRRKGGDSSRETLILKKREILNEMIDTEESGPLDVRGQVERLRKAEKEKKAAAAPMEDKWGSKQHRRKGSRWLFAAIFLIVIPLLAFVVAVSLSRTAGNGSATRAAGSLNLDEEDPLVVPFDTTDPVSWFQENSVEAFEDAIEILDQVNAGETAEATLPLMRDVERTKEHMRASGFEWEAEFNTHDPRRISWEYGASGETGYMVISGIDSLFRPFRAYFVNTARGLRLDWAATTAWSEIPVGNLEEAAPELPVSVRGWLVKKPHFDSEGAKLISWYEVTSADGAEHVWAYTPTDSEVDLGLKNALNYGLIVMDRIEQTRMTLRLRMGDRGKRSNEFELIEFVADDWVQP